MKRQHDVTAQRPTTQPSLCAILSKKLCFMSPKSQGEGKPGPSSAPSLGKGRADDRERREVRNELKHAVRRIKRITPFLSETYLSQYASEKGKKGCETCNLSKEAYKSSMNSVVKVVEVIADGVISKIQREMLDKEDEKQGTNKPQEQDNKKDEKRLSIKFEVYCRKNIDHNLKCVLLQLQEIIGDTLLQLCYCKMKKDPGDKKCKQYNLSAIDLEQLKFEYSNLTNKIILLFKTPSSKRTDSPQKCVDCIKEEITDYINILEDMLKNGRNLKVTMRNENVGDKCCSRTTPHVHAMVQGKPIVLKYKLPFEVTQPPSKPHESLEIESPIYSDVWSNDESATEEAQPYDEWPKYFHPEPVKEVDEDSQIKPIKDDSFPAEREIPSSRKSSLLEKEASGKPPSIVSNKSVKSSKSSDASPVQNLSEKQSPSKITPSVKSSDSSVVTPPPSRISKTRSSIPSKKSLKSSDSKTQDQQDSDLEKYCGCNFSSVYEKLNVEQYKTKDVDLQPERTSSSFTESDSLFTSSDESESSESMGRKRKKVSFVPEEKRTVMYVRDTPPQSVFDNHEHLPKSSKTRNSKIEKVRGHSLTHVNSVTLVKNKNSLSEHLKTTKDCKQSNIVEVSFIGVPQYEIKPSLPTGSNISDQQIMSSSSLNKQQVNEVMKDLGATKLLSVNFPAECCTNNKKLHDFKCTTDLPFSASLHSLPLDQDDLKHITGVVEKLISSEDIVLDPDFDKQWEIQYIEEPDDVENEPELHKSAMARGNASNICIEIQAEKTLTKKKPAKNLQKDVINLPTINEEKMSSDEKPIRRSLPNDKEVGLMKDNTNKNRISSKFRTMELRYLTIEYPHKNKNKTPERAQSSKKIKSNAHPCFHKYHHKQLDKYVKINTDLNNINYASRIDKGYVCDDYSYLCSHVLKAPDKNKSDPILKRCRCNKNSSLSPVEEMIMLDIIYLTSDTNDNKVFTVYPSNNILEPCDNNIKLSKSISSNEFFKENIVFETVEEIKMKNNLSIKIKSSEAKEDLTSEIEETFQESSFLVGNCEISSVNENLNKKNYFLPGFCKEKDILNSRKQGETSLSSEYLKLKTNFLLIQVSPSIEKEQGFLKNCNLNWNDIPVKSDVNLNCHNLNHRNYFISKEAKSKIVKHLNPVKSDNYDLKQFIRKPTTLNNTAIGFKMVKCKIITPVVKFPKIKNIPLHYEIPQLKISPNNQKLLKVDENFELVKSCTNVKTIHKLESVPCPREVQDLLKSNILKEKIHNTLMNTNLSVGMKKIINLSSQMSNFSTNPLTSGKKDDSCSFGYLGSIFYLYDVDGQPVTETSQKPIHSVSSDTLMKLEKYGLSLCDLHNNPIVDSTGEDDFNTLEPRSTKKFLTDSGDPMDLYEGRPHDKYQWHFA